MKKLLLIVCFAAFGATTFAQEEEVKPISYSEVVSVEGVSANELFLRARAWFAKSYNNSKMVLQMSQDNMLVGNAMYATSIEIGAMYGANVEISYSITIQCRDGRYKYTIDSIVADQDKLGYGHIGLLTTAPIIAVRGMAKKQRNILWQKTKEAFDTFQQALILSLFVDMTAITSNDAW